MARKVDGKKEKERIFPFWENVFSIPSTSYSHLWYEHESPFVFNYCTADASFSVDTITHDIFLVPIVVR